MKTQMTIILVLLFGSSLGQNRVFFANSDSCKQYTNRHLDEAAISMKLIDRCTNFSSIQQVIFEKGTYSRNGSYCEYYDTTFANLRKIGQFKNGIETGLWKEYYSGGQLKLQGSCRIVKLMQIKPDVNTILIIDTENPEDTTRLSLAKVGIDGIRNLAQYHYFPQFESSGLMLPGFFSIKEGAWLYYNESGALVKKETFKAGKLVKSE